MLGRIFRIVAWGIVVTLLQCAQVQALVIPGQIFVSATGNDGNTCFFPTNACQTLGAALAKVEAGGTITLVDSVGVGYSGLFTIDKSVTIIGQEGANTLSVPTNSGAENGTAITINAGPNAVVTLSGLNFAGIGFGQYAIRLLSGKLHVQHCLFDGFRGSPGIALSIESTANSQVFITDSAFVGNKGGLLVQPSGSASARVFLEGVHFDRNTTYAIRAVGPTTNVRISNSVLTGNHEGLKIESSAHVISLGNNVIEDNGINGAPTSTVNLK